MKINKEIKEWAFILGLFGILYITGLHTEVAGFAQRMVLKTGLITPNLEAEETIIKDTDYNFELVDLNGNPTNLQEFRNKVIFMNIWATWCAPCIAELPSIESLAEKTDPEKIQFVMISTDRNVDKLRKFIERKDIKLPVYRVAGVIPEVFHSPSIPTTYVVAPGGKIVSKKVGMANYDRKKFLKFLNKHAL